MNEENYNKQEDSPSLRTLRRGESPSTVACAVRSLGIDPMTGEEILLEEKWQDDRGIRWVDLVPQWYDRAEMAGNINLLFAYKGFEVDVSMAYKIRRTGL